MGGSSSKGRPETAAPGQESVKLFETEEGGESDGGQRRAASKTTLVKEGDEKNCAAGGMMTKSVSEGSLSSLRVLPGPDLLAPILAEAAALRAGPQQKAESSSCCGKALLKSRRSASETAKAEAAAEAHVRKEIEMLRARGEALEFVFSAKHLGLVLGLAQTETGRRCATVAATSPVCEHYADGIAPTDELIAIDEHVVKQDPDFLAVKALQARLAQGRRPLRLVFLPGERRARAFSEQAERSAMRGEDHRSGGDYAHRAERAQKKLTGAAASESTKAAAGLQDDDGPDDLTTDDGSRPNWAKTAAEAAEAAGRRSASAHERLDAVWKAHEAARKASDEGDLSTASRASAAARNALEAGLGVVCEVLLDRGKTAAEMAASCKREAELALARKDVLCSQSPTSSEHDAATPKALSAVNDLPAKNLTTVFEPEGKVRVCGLRKATSFNDRVGVVKGFEEDSHRILVHFDDGSIVSVRGVNLCPIADEGAPDLAVGSKIAITGLRTQLEFNGVEGVVKEYDRVTNRYYVATDNGHEVALRPGHLEVIAKQTASPAAFHTSVKAKAKRAASAAKRAAQACTELSKWVAALNLAAELGGLNTEHDPTILRKDDTLDASLGSRHENGDSQNVPRFVNRAAEELGARVVLVGVLDYPQLNGAECVSRGFEKGHYVVERPDTGAQYSVPASMLVAMDRGGASAALSRHMAQHARTQANAAKELAQQAALVFPLVEASPSSRSTSSVDLADIDADDIGLDDAASLRGGANFFGLFEKDLDEDARSKEEECQIVPSGDGVEDDDEAAEDDDDGVEDDVVDDDEAVEEDDENEAVEEDEENEAVGDGVPAGDRESESFALTPLDDLPSADFINAVGVADPYPYSASPSSYAGSPRVNNEDSFLAADRPDLADDDDDDEVSESGGELDEAVTWSTAAPAVEAADIVDEPTEQLGLSKPVLSDAVSEPDEGSQASRQVSPRVRTRRQLDLLSGTPPTSPRLDDEFFSAPQPQGQQPSCENDADPTVTNDLLDMRPDVFNPDEEERRSSSPPELLGLEASDGAALDLDLGTAGRETPPDGEASQAVNVVTPEYGDADGSPIGSPIGSPVSLTADEYWSSRLGPVDGRVDDDDDAPTDRGHFGSGDDAGESSQQTRVIPVVESEEDDVSTMTPPSVTGRLRTEQATSSPSRERSKPNELLDHPIFARQAPAMKENKEASSEDVRDRASLKKALVMSYEESLAQRREEARRVKEQQAAANAAAAKLEIQQRVGEPAPSENTLRPVVEFERFGTGPDDDDDDDSGYIGVAGDDDDELDFDDDDDDDDGHLVTPSETYTQTRPMSYDEIVRPPPPGAVRASLSPLVSFQLIPDQEPVPTPRAARSPLVEFERVESSDNLEVDPPDAVPVSTKLQPKADHAPAPEDDSLYTAITTTLFGSWSADTTTAA